jgi:hypothetical protein
MIDVLPDVAALRKLRAAFLAHTTETSGLWVAVCVT